MQRRKKKEEILIRTRWRAVIWALGCGLWVLEPALGASLAVNSANSYYVNQANWGSNGLPAQPTAEWRFADGLGYDTSGGVFVNHGSLSLPTGLAILNAPSFAESPLAPHQSALQFNGSTNRLGIDDATVLDCNSEALSIFVIVRAAVAGATNLTIVGKGCEDAVGGAGYSVRLTSSSAVFVASDGTGSPPGTTPSVTSSIAALSGQWIGVGVCFRPATACSLYVNGAYAARNNAGMPALGSLSNSYKVAVGAQYGGARAFTSSIGLVMIWDGVAVTASQMDSLYRALMPNGSSAEPFPSIQSAVRQATAGDVISVASGDYRETVEVTKALTITGIPGQSGMRPTLLGSGLPSAAGVIGLQIGAKVDLGFLDVRGYSAGIGLLADSTSDGSLMHHLTLDSCLTGAKFYGRCDNDTLVNCTIDGAGLAGGFGVRTVESTESGLASLVWLNSIVYDAATGLEVDPEKFSVTADYNGLYGGTTLYSGISAGAHDVQLDPNFRGVGQNDYSLRWGSRMVNQGVLVHSGVYPFNAVQIYPDIGAWELPVGTGRGYEYSWARGAWGERR